MENNMIDKIIKSLEKEVAGTLNIMSQDEYDGIVSNDNSEEFDAGYNQGLNQALVIIKQVKGDNNENL